MFAYLPECQPHMNTSCSACHLWWCLVGRVKTQEDPPQCPQTCWCRRYSVVGFLWRIRCFNKNLSKLISCSPIDALCTEPCLWQKGVCIPLWPVRLLVVIRKEKCILPTLTKSELALWIGLHILENFLVGKFNDSSTHICCGWFIRIFIWIFWKKRPLLGKSRDSSPTLAPPRDRAGWGSCTWRGRRRPPAWWSRTGCPSCSSCCGGTVWSPGRPHASGST